jgi:hypothetical protein
MSHHGVMRISDADESDICWEDWSPHYRVFLTQVDLESPKKEPRAVSQSMFDIEDADLSEVVQFAEERTKGRDLFAIALVINSDAELPGERGLLWLTGLDVYDVPTNDAQARARAAMVARSSAAGLH